MTSHETRPSGSPPSAATISSLPAALLWQSYVIAQFVSGSVGLISKDILALALEVSGDAVVLHAVLEQPSPQASDDLDHMCFELDVLLGGHTTISHQETIGFGEAWLRPGRIPVYRGYTE